MSKATSGHEKIQRWTDLIAALLSRDTPATFEELLADVPAYKEEATGLSKDSIKRTFERDKDELREYGVPIETSERDPGDNTTSTYRLSRNTFYLPYLLAASDKAAPKPRQPEGFRMLGNLAFEPDEIAAVAAGFARLDQLHDPLLSDDARAAVRALAFDLAGFDNGLSDVKLLGADDGATSKTFEALSRALRTRKTVTIAYQSPSDSQPGDRHVHPYGLFFVSAHWYLAAFDPMRQDMRNFRLSRMSAVAVNKARPGTPDYDIPAEFRLRTHAELRRPWELGHAEAHFAEVRIVGSGGAVLAAAESGEVVPDHPDMRRFPVRRFDSFARWLLSFGGDVVPVSPPELVDEYRALVRETLKRYGGLA